RGVKPPVFGGYCGEKIEVYTPSQPLEMEYIKPIDLAYTYVWNDENKEFRTLAEELGLNTDDVCVKAVSLHR
ncbi:MAG TPA: hypothetical protein V6C96_04880, partial [Vampirovibrionales bacterium]